jgi:hypothetical protein
MSGSQDPIATTTLANVARGAWDGVSEHNPLFSEMKKSGTIEYDVAGASDGSTLNSTTYELSGAVEAGRFQPTISAPGQDISSLFTFKKRHQRWVGSFGEIVNATAFDRGALRRNKNSQIVDLSKTEIPAMIKDTITGTNGLQHQVLQMVQPAYAGNGLPLYGLPSFLPGNGYTGSAAYSLGAVSSGGSATTGTALGDFDIEGYTPPTGTGNGTLSGAVPTAAFKEVQVAGSNTYLGLALKPGQLVVDDAQWDAWTPTLVNTASSAWTSTVDDEDDAIEKFLSYLIFRLSRFSSTDKSKIPNVGLLDKTFFEYLGAKKSSRETIFVTPDQKSPMVPDTSWPVHFIFHAGVRWFWDENMPSSTAYAFPVQQMKLKVQPLYRNLEDGNPLKVSGEDAGILETEITRDPNRRQWLVSSTFPGQLICNPRYFGRASPYSTGAA